MRSILISKKNNNINICITKIENITDQNKILIDYNNYLKDKNIIINSINKITNKNSIYTLTIYNKSLLNDIISIVEQLKFIKIIYININIMLNNKYVLKLIESDNIKIIKCYDINTIMYDLIDDKDKVFITYNKIYNTKFYKKNNILTNSEIYYKKEITIDCNFTIDDIDYFFYLNRHIEKIYINYIDNCLIKKIINILIKHNKHDIIIFLNINEKNANILNKNSKYLKRLEKKKCKKYNIDLKSNYSNEYKGKFLIKHLNNIYLKNSMIVIFAFIIISSFIIGYYEYKTKKVIVEVQNISGVLDNLDNDKNLVVEDNNEEVENQENVVENNNTNSSSNNQLTEDFNKLSSINSDFVGWLKIKNTKVNYPVVRYTDNKYYLNHNFYNAVNNAGWVFMDYRNEIDEMDQNTIIYAHSNTIGETMFGSIYYTLKESWYKNKDNQIISFNSLYENMSFQIFAIYITDPEYYYIWTNFYNNEERFNTFINEVKEKSIYNFDVDVSMTDKILTLSTCYNHGKQRIAIHAKKI